MFTRGLASPISISMCKSAILYFIAEIKSLTDQNEEKQLRLGLGQVLRYANQLGPAASAVLVAERCPRDKSWGQLCDQLGVILIWPDVFVERLPRSAVQT